MKINSKRLEANDIIELHNKLIKIGGGDYGVQNISSLDFALSHIKYNNNNQDEFYYNLALLLRNITELHPFLDGNKRTGIVIVELILFDNDLEFKISENKKEKFIIEVAMGKYSDLGKLSKILKKYSRKIKF